MPNFPGIAQLFLRDLCMRSGYCHSAGEAADITKAMSLGQLTAELQEEGPKAGIGQVSKWGFVPGDDNTTDLDLERNGRGVLLQPQTARSLLELRDDLYGGDRGKRMLLQPQ